MTSQPIRPTRSDVRSIDGVTYAATIPAGRFATIDPSDGQAKAIGSAVVSKVVVTAEAKASGERGTVYSEGHFVCTNLSGGALQRGDFVVPSSTDPMGADAGSSDDVLVLEVIGPYPANPQADVVASLAAMEVRLHPNATAAALVA